MLTKRERERKRALNILTNRVTNEEWRTSNDHGNVMHDHAMRLVPNRCVLLDRLTRSEFASLKERIHNNNEAWASASGVCSLGGRFRSTDLNDPWQCMEAIRSLNREHRDAIIVLSKTFLRLTNKNDPMWRLIPLPGLSLGIQLTRDEKENSHSKNAIVEKCRRLLLY